MLPSSFSLTVLMSLLVGGLAMKLGLGGRPAKPEQVRRQFADKVVWVTGASSGIGEALALSLAAHGAKLVLSARRRERLEEVAGACEAAAGGRPVAKILPFDLAESDKDLLCKGALAAKCWNRPVDVLVNNAGISSRGAAVDTTLAVDSEVMHVDFVAPMALTKGVLPDMLERKQGQIIVISSVQGRLGIPFRTSYAAAKHALQGFFDALRPEVADANVGVLVVSPGYVRTALSLNAVTGSGAKYAKMDETTAKGMAPEELAAKIIDAATRGKSELIVADLKTRAAIVARTLAPNLLIKMLVSRARKERAKGAETG